MAALPSDPTLKALVEVDPNTWPALLGRPVGPTTLIDADIATVSGAGDKVLHVAAATPYLMHLEFVSGHDSAQLPRKLHLRNALLGSRHEMLVRSVAILLHPAADSRQLTGVYQETFPNEEPYQVFRYDVVRVWQLPPAVLLTGGLAALPLAVISDVTEAELPGIIERMKQRLSRPRARKQAQTIWAASFILMGLRYSPDLAARLFRGIVAMKESSTYQSILEEGRKEAAVEQTKHILRSLGTSAFGTPDSRTTRVIEQLNNLDRLEKILERIRTANSWDELLEPIESGRRGRRRPE